MTVISSDWSASRRYTSWRRRSVPNRILRESIRTSPTVDLLSASAEVLFYRMITVADDYGRFEADPRILRSMCFPLRVDCMTTAAVEALYAELEAAGLVSTYTVNAKKFGVFATWGKYQRVRAAKSKFPEPPIQAASPTDDGGLPSPAVKCPQPADIGGQPPPNAPVFESRNTRVESEKASALPPSFSLTPKLLQTATKHGLRMPEKEFATFCSHHRAKGSMFACWESAWGNWCSRSHKFEGPSRPSSRSPGPPMRHVASVAEVEAFAAKQAAEFEQRAKAETERYEAADKNKERTP